MEQKNKRENELLYDELISLTNYHFVTIEEFEKAMKNPKIKEKYDKMFEEEKEEKTSIKKENK